MSNKVIGIDLGTGFSTVSIIEGGKPKVIANPEGAFTTPSVVYIEGNERKVGASAKRSMIMKPKNTISFVKRFMGAEYSDEDVQKMLNQVTYEVVNKNNKPYIKIDDKEYSPEEISSFIISYMKKVAEDYYGEEVKDAVITCPAWYTNNARESVKLAGELAGLNVLRVINEPTAAILSSNIDLDGKDEKIVAVNDFGSGTEDVSICSISDGMVEVLSSYGDVFLGGQNIDNEIVNWMADEFAKDHSGLDLRKDPMALSRLVEAAEKAKIELSSSTQTEINLPYITVQDNVPQMLVMTLTRAKFENMVRPIIQKMCDCLSGALKKANIDKSKVDEILLVGGSCRIPLVEKMLNDEFGIKIDKSANLDEAVGLGASIQANTLANPEDAKNSVLLVDVTPISLGIRVNENEMNVLIPADTTIPTSKENIYTTAVDNQSSVSILVLQGERPMASDNKQIGMFNLDGIAPAPRGIPQIKVKFDIDANGILSVSAIDMATNKEQHITIQNSNSLSKEEIERIKKDAEDHKAEDQKRQAEMKKINEAEAYMFSVKSTIENESFKDKFTDDEKKKLTELCDDLKKAIDNKDMSDIDIKKKALEDAFNPIISKIYKDVNPGNSGSTVDMNDMFNKATGGQSTTTSGNTSDGPEVQNV